MQTTKLTEATKRVIEARNDARAFARAQREAQETLRVSLGIRIDNGGTVQCD